MEKDYIKCFKFHKHECVVCGEEKVLTVLHFDGNKDNDSPKNLIPLCPTHHAYWDSKYRCDVEEKINEYHQEISRIFDFLVKK